MLMGCAGCVPGCKFVLILISKRNITQIIGKPNNRANVIVNMHTTSDIIKQMQNAHYENSGYAKQIANTFRGSNNLQTCKNVFNWIKKNIQYRIEPAHLQSTKSIQRLISDGYGDCKHYSGFFAAILTALGLKNKYRFVSFNSSNIPTHVYVVAYDENNREILCDAVLDDFNTQKPYRHKIDKSMMVHLSGIDGIDGIDGIGKKSKAQKQQAKAKRVEKRQAVVKKVKKAGAKVKAVAKKAGAKIKSVAKKVGKGAKKFGLAAPRGAFLGLVLLNVHGFATNLAKKIATDPAKVQNIWQKLGGDFNSLKKNVAKGVKHKRIFGPGDQIGAFSVAGALATAAPIIIAMKDLIGATKSVTEQAANDFVKETGQKVENTIFDGGGNAPGGSTGIVTPSGASTTLTSDDMQHDEAHTPSSAADKEMAQESAKAETPEGNTTTTPGGVNTKYLLIGGAALAALFLFNKKR